MLNSIADNNEFSRESMDFPTKFVENDELPITTELLYKTILFGIAKSTENEAHQTELHNYMQAAFNMTNTRHDDLLHEVIEENPAEMFLNIDVIDAQQLDTKNSNGLANPFVTMHIESSAVHQCTTTVKSNTLNPLWEEQFSLPLTNGIDTENLIVEVWHFKSDERLREKIKSPRQLGKFIKKIAIISSGSQDQELIGRCTIPLKTIPASGLCAAYSLCKNDKPKLRGSISLQMSIDALAAKKFNQTSHQDRKHLLRIILQHELNISNMASYDWRGQFSDLGEAIFAHSGHTKNPRAHALAQWSEFTAFHSTHPLSLELFENLLMALLPFLKCHKITMQNELHIFWDGVKKLIPSCFSVLRNSQRRSDADMESLQKSLSILATINGFTTPSNGIDLFPTKIYGWLDKTINDSISNAVEQAIRSRAQDYLLKITEFQFVHQENIESNLTNIIKVMDLIDVDLQQAADVYNKLFMTKMQCDYGAVCYNYYANEISECFEMTIERTCEHLVQASAQSIDDSPIGKMLFDVYLALKRFSLQSVQFCSESTAHLNIHNYHEWFADGVAYWIDMHHSIAFKRIKKAIEVDQLIPVDDVVKYSTSAVDTFAIFESIKEFWLHLNWPDIENAFTFVAKIVDNICHCCVFYAEQMAARVAESKNDDCFCATPDLCLIINDIDHLRDNLSKFITELDVDGIIANLAAYRSHADAQRCQKTLKNIIENAMDSIENQMIEFIENIAYRMCTHLHKCVWDAAECLHRDSQLIDQLMENLEKSLATLSAQLNDTNFQRILAAVWEKFTIFFGTLLQNCLDTQCAPQFYTNIYQCLQIIVKSFKCNSSTCSLIESKPIAEFERILQLHCRETDYLIHQYCVERYKQQLNMNGTPFGQLTIRANFTDNQFLELEIMNARNLVFNANESLLNPFVEITFSPNERHCPKMKLKTVIQFRTTFPLFDEKFVIPINKKQQTTENYLIMFTVKNYNKFSDRFGISKKFIAECFITLDDINRSNSSEQMHLTLSSPNSLDNKYLSALKLRKNDKIATKFFKTQKQKLSSSTKRVN